MIGSKTRTAVIAVVTTVWVCNFGAGFVVSGYKPSEAANGAFLLVVGALVAAGSKKDGEGGEK